MPLQFAWQDLRTDFFEFDAGYGYDRIMPYMFGIYLYVFSVIQATVEYYTNIFGLMQTDWCLALELTMGNYLRIFLAEVWYK